MTETFESEVRDMCNLSEGVMEKGIQKSIQQGLQLGEIQMLVKQVKKGHLTIIQAAEDAEMTVEQFQEEMEKMS